MGKTGCFLALVELLRRRLVPASVPLGGSLDEYSTVVEDTEGDVLGGSRGYPLADELREFIHNKDSPTYRHSRTSPVLPCGPLLAPCLV